MIIGHAIPYLSSAWYSILSFNQFFIIKILLYWFVTKIIGNYRKYDIFFNFRFTENMIFLQIAENQENMIFTLSVFTKMLFFMKCAKWSFNWNFIKTFIVWLTKVSLSFSQNFFFEILDNTKACLIFCLIYLPRFAKILA